MINTVALRRFYEQVDLWAIKHRTEVESMRTLIKDNKPMRIEINHYFTPKRLLTKTGKLKRLDLDNRLKALLDAIGNLGEFDDSLILELTARKKISTNGMEYSDVLLVRLS